MTREELRTELLTSCDNLRNSVIWKFMSLQQRNISICGRQLWAEDNPIVNATLDAYNTLLQNMTITKGASQLQLGTNPNPNPNIDLLATASLTLSSDDSGDTYQLTLKVGN